MASPIKGKCPICLRRNQWLVNDHCHESGERRAKLCTRCNNGLGAFRDDIEMMMRAVQYLRTYRQLHMLNDCWDDLYVSEPTKKDGIRLDRKRRAEIGIIPR